MSNYEKVCAIRGDQGKAIRALMDRIADKWTLLIVATLHERRLRFSELQQHIPGISQRMLSLTLKHLARDGLVTRTSHPEVPPRVEYELTPLATTLIPHAIALADWAIENNPAIDALHAEREGADLALAGAGGLAEDGGGVAGDGRAGDIPLV